MIWLPVLADNSELDGIKEWEQGFNKEEFLKKGRPRLTRERKVIKSSIKRESEGR